LSIRIAYAANRSIGARGLELLLEHDIRPIALLLPERGLDEQADGLPALVPGVPEFRGTRFREAGSVCALRGLEPDYILSVHFPYLIPPEVLSIPRHGTLNLHPALLPFNRGWHTPSWAILDGTPFGATLHWVDEGLDTGDVAIQKELDISPGDTAHGLYRRVLGLELDVLREALPLLVRHELPRWPQADGGTSHTKKDLLEPSVARLDLAETAPVGDLLRRLRALTTDRWSEAAWFEAHGRRYRVRIEVREEET
jgi:methionyl-tRNA formyltransferase